MLFHTVDLADGSGVYVQQVTARLETALGAEALTRAWQAVLDAWPNLRASFAWAGLPRPLQRIHRAVEMPVAVLDWRGLDAAAQTTELDRFLAEDRIKGFDPTSAPLMRVTLARLAEASWQVVWSHHHLLLDGWSMPIVFQGVLASLAAVTRGSPGPAGRPRLPPPHRPSGRSRSGSGGSVLARAAGRRAGTVLPGSRSQARERQRHGGPSSRSRPALTGKLAKRRAVMA